VLKQMARFRGREHYFSALRIVLLYAVFAALWIYFSDTILATIVRNPETFVRLSVMKGFLFIVVTGIFLYFLIAGDIIRIRSISSALAESDARFRSYVESAPTAIMVFDEEGRCIDYNPAALRLLDTEAEAMQGLRRQDVLPAEWRGPQEGGDTPIEFARAGRDGHLTWIQLRAVRLRGAQTLFFCQDITERVQAEEELRETNDRLLQAGKMEAVGRLAGGVAHDFNNILTAIYGYSDILLGSAIEGQESHGFLVEIRKAAARAASLTQQLLAFSRRQTLLPRSVDMNELLRNLAPMLHRLIGEDVEMSLDLEESVWRVRVDPARMEQALVNLAVNARDAMPKGGRLVLAARNVVTDGQFARAHPEAAPGEYVAVAVTDSGTGMDAETRSHLFEPFYTTKQAGKGTGLGLASVYGIVKQSGGVITVQTAPLEGSTFTLYLPRLGEPVDEPRETEVTPRPAAPGKELILYAEDDEAVRGFVTMILKGSGYQVLSAASGEEALQRAVPFIGSLGLVITDVVMPGMNGRDLVVRLREMRADLKCLFTSGYTDQAFAQREFQIPGAILLEKPIDSKTLLATVREILDAAATG
jgi:two-component system, cell cycle sensor histidine kinase and response regulator CckA